MALHDIETNGPAGGFAPGPVLLLGAPGVGKGTQAQLLMGTFAIPQISTGDLLRQHVEDGTALGLSAKRLMDAGQYVPDDVVNGMVADRLEQPDAGPGYVLDGFPRTLAQAHWLDGWLSSRNAATPLVAVQVHVPEDELLRRITGRRVCPVCKRIYNIYSKPPETDMLCDVDGTPLVHRSDDTEEAFRRRMQEYAAKTEEVIRHYRSLGRFAEIDGQGTLDEVEARIIAAVRTLRSAAAVQDAS